MARSIQLIRLATMTLALAVAGCASLAGGAYVPEGQNLTRYRTYQWASGNPLSTGDPRLDNNRFFDERVRAAVDRELAGRRFEKAPLDRVDLVVHYHASFTQGIDVRGIDPEYKYCKEERCGPYSYEAGTLLIDLVDATTRQLVWRGWVEGRFDGVIDNQRSMEATVDDTVKQLLRRLPKTF
jgi:hypothetical protein